MLVAQAIAIGALAGPTADGSIGLGTPSSRRW
jgi:hypothetical protein